MSHGMSCQAPIESLRLQKKPPIVLYPFWWINAGFPQVRTQQAAQAAAMQSQTAVTSLKAALHSCASKHCPRAAGWQAEMCTTQRLSFQVSGFLML